MPEIDNGTSLLRIQNLVRDSGYHLPDIRNSLIDHNAQEVGSGFNLIEGNSIEGIDVLFGSGRFLIYNSSDEDCELETLFKKNNIPLLQLASLDIKGNIRAIQIVYQTSRLDQRSFREQSPTDGSYLGAIEIMEELGRYYGAIYKATDGKFPVDCCMSRIAIINGEEHFLRIIPPLSVTKQDIVKVSSAFSENLDLIDPENDHTSQISAFENGFNASII
ncbi:hypothetical protein KW795_02080 [Candidatus Microgenomates bacterium]|nr:hypothetical protein [Candidatus Microgenomates bacterium]